MPPKAMTVGLPYADVGYHVDARTMTTCSIDRLLPVFPICEMDVRAFDIEVIVAERHTQEMTP